MRSRLPSLIVVLLLACLICPAQRRGGRKIQGGGAKTDSRAARFVEEANKLAEEKKWPEAIDAFKLAIRLDPNYQDAYSGLGDAYLQSGKWQEALATYKEEIHVAPNSADAYYNLGYAYNTMSRHGEAFAPLLKAINLDPGFAEARYAIGYAYLRGEKYENALGYLKSAIRLKPDYDEAHYSLALVYLHTSNKSALDEERNRLATLNPKLLSKLDKDIQAFAARSNNASPQLTPPMTEATKTPRPSSSSTAPAINTAVQSPARPVPQNPTRADGGNPATDNSAFELSFWESIRNSNDPEDYKAYLKQFPNGVFADLARKRAGLVFSETRRAVAPSQPGANAVSTAPPAKPEAQKLPAPAETIGTNQATAPTATAPPIAAAANSNEAFQSLEKIFQSLKPAVSKRDEVARVLSQPVRAVSQTMDEHSPQPGTGKIYVEYREGPGAVDRIEIYLPKAIPRADLIKSLALPDQAAANSKDSKGRRVEYFGPPKFLAIMFATEESTSSVGRIGYFSRELFNQAAGTSYTQETGTTAGTTTAKGLPPSLAAQPAEKSWTLPPNIIINLRMASGLSSKTAQVDDRISAMTASIVSVDGRVIIPAGLTVQGHVSQVVPAKRMGKPGIIAVEFDELVFKNGTHVKLTGTITAVTKGGRQKIDPEGQAKGSGNKKPAVFIGSATAIGAVIGGLSNGGSGALIGGATGAGAGIVAAMLSKGPEAEIKSGLLFGFQISQPLVIKESYLAESKTP
jgi:tetratricopeptide (TPR) repeat protein